MVNPVLQSCHLAAVKVTWDVCDLWESKWWAQHRSSWLQILVNWILQELRRQTPPCRCLRNANNPNQIVNRDWCCWGQGLECPLCWESWFQSLFKPSWEPRFTQLPSGRSVWVSEGCRVLEFASFRELLMLKCWESRAIQFCHHSEGSGSV